MIHFLSSRVKFGQTRLFKAFAIAVVVVLSLQVRAAKPTILVNERIFTNAPFAECHASTIVELADGSLLAAWFGGTRESNKDVEIWVSRRVNGHWSAPRSIANGVINSDLRYACWNPVLFRWADKISLYYKVGPSPREWWGMEMHSVDGGESWTAARSLPEGLLGPIKNKPLALPSGVVLSPSSVETLDGRWHAHIERSVDGGDSWEKIEIDPGNKAKVIQPTLLRYADGKVQALLRSDQNRVMQSWSSDEGKTWGPLLPTNVLNPNSGIDAVSLPSGAKVLIYNPCKGGSDWSDGRKKLSVAVSVDGENWEDVCLLEDHDNGEYSYPSVIYGSDNLLHIVYTDNRKSIKYVCLSFN